MRLTRTLNRSIVSIVFAFAMYADATGQNFHWTKQFAGANWDEGTAIATDGSGNVYSGGNFPDTITFGPGANNLIAVGQQDVFVTKLDGSGNVIWVKQIGGSGWKECNDIAVDNNGNVCITGTFLGTADFDPGPATFNITSTVSTNAFICKLDASGNFLWAKRFGELTSSTSINKPVIANSVAIDANGSVYTTGSFDGTADFDPGSGVVSLTPGQGISSDIFVSKLDASGNFVWVKQLGGQAFEGGHAIAIDNIGNIVSTGFFNGTVDFDPGPSTFNLSAPPGNNVMYVSKLNSTGDFVWAKQMTGITGYALAIDNIGNIYASGDYSNDSVTIEKLDPSGNIVWSKQIGADMAWSLAVDGGSNLYITGQFHGTADFDPGAGSVNLSSIGGTDSYIAKYSSTGNLIWAKQLAGTSQVWSQAIAVDGPGNVYATGYFIGTADFNPGPATYSLTSTGTSYDVFVHKLGLEDLGVQHFNPDDTYDAHPNPTSGKFSIEIGKGYRGSEVVIRNMIGGVVNRRQLKRSDRIELEIDEAPGLYFVEIYHEDGKKGLVKILKY